MRKSDLSVGMFGDGVKALQAQLQQLSFYVSRNEIQRDFFGPATRQAVLRLQKERGLRVTGVVDQRTAAVIDAMAVLPPVTQKAGAEAGAASGSDPVPIAPLIATVAPSSTPVAPASQVVQSDHPLTEKAVPATSVRNVGPSGAKPSTTVQAAAAAASRSITELAVSANLKITPGLARQLAGQHIRTLGDVRRAGGLARTANPGDATAAQLIDAHANLSLVSPDIAANSELIKIGFNSTLAIARMSRSNFLMAAAPDLGDLAAARIHAQSTALYRALDQTVIAARVDAGNGIPTGLPSQVDTLLNPYDLQRCQCSACEAAPSPGAYLADLLAYILQRLLNRGQPVLLQFLVDTFHQPFGDLRTDCEAVDQQVRQVRICIEVLRSYLRTHPPTYWRLLVLQSAEYDYLMATYAALLAGLGTTYEEIRLARNAERLTRTALADRLGLTIDPYGSSRPDPLDRLLLDLPTSPIQPFVVPEGPLERLFGLADTTRNPLSAGPTVNDTAALIARWNLNGIAWGKNTDPDGTLYVTLGHPDATHFQISLYRDSHRLGPDLVGSGSQTISGGVLAGSIAIIEANGSGLDGRFEIAAPVDNASIELGAVPFLTSWQLQTLRAEWLAEDHPSDAFSDGVTAAPLAALPSGFVIPAPLRPRLWYDVSAQVLFFQGVMARADLEQLLALSTDPACMSAIKTLYVQSQRPSVIDPDVIGPDDFRAATPKAQPADPDQPFDVWLRRRNWVDAGLMNLASRTKTVNGVTVPDIDGTQGILAAMSQPWTYVGTSIVPWRADTSSFQTLWENLAEGVDVDVIGLQLAADLGLDIDAFNRLMQIWHQDQAAAADPRSPAVSADEWRELYSVLTQAAKARFFAAWRKEEGSLSVIADNFSFFGSDAFIVSLREPAIGDWPPNGEWPPLGPVTQPLIDPNLVALTDLPEIADTSAITLWNNRAAQVEAFTKAIRAAREQGGSNGVEAALKLALGDPLPVDLDQLARDLLSPDPNVVATATATVQTVLFMSVDAFERLMMIRAMDADPNPAGRPTPAFWIEFYAILTSAETRRLAYPTWLTEEANLTTGTATWTQHKGYWLARKAALPPWRSSIDLRSQWHAALALRCRTPIIDPDLITTADFANPFSGDPAFDLWQARSTWVDSLLHAPPPKDVNAVDAALLNSLGIGGQDFVAIGRQRDAGAEISLRLAQVGLTSDAFDALLGIRALVANNASILDSEWVGFWSILAQVTKQRRYAIWLLEEAGHQIGGHKIVLGPDLFQLPTAPITDPITPPQLPFWRTTLATRQAWEDTLTSRLEQQATVVEADANLVDSVEGMTLTQLRDALVGATDAPGADLAAKADWFTTNLMIDAETGGCQKTTRIEQALETLQTVMTGIRDGQVGGFDVKLASAPAAISRGAGPDRIDVFVRGSDSALWHKRWDGTAMPGGTWQDWDSLDGVIGAAPTVVSPFGNLLEVFALGSDGRLYHRQSDADRWSDWEQVGDPNFKLGSAPAAVCPDQSTVTIFAKGLDGALWQMSGDWDLGSSAWSWQQWQTLTIPVPLQMHGSTSAPAVVIDRTGTYHVFIVGGDGALWHAQDTASWSGGWVSLGGQPLTSDPVAVSYSSGAYDVFALGGASDVVRRTHNTLFGWGPWTSLGGYATQGPGACSSTSGRVDVFAAGGDFALWHKWWDGAWHGWEAANELTIGDPQGSFDEEWKWMGSYATWRAAILVFLYPENLLQPTLRKWQTPAFQQLVADVQGNPTLTPEQARNEATKYSSYYSDVCSMKIEASRAGVDTQLHDANRVPTMRRMLWYMIGLGGATNRAYWSSWDWQAPKDYAQTFWDFVPGFSGQFILNLIDAVPFATADGHRYLCLFVKARAAGAQTLLLTRYDLEFQTWDGGGAITLDLPEQQTLSFEAVVMPQNDEQTPPVLRVKVASGEIYERALNSGATSLATGNWTLLVWTPWSRIDQNLTAPPIQGASGSVLAQVGAVSRDADHLDIFVTKNDGSINWASFSAQPRTPPWSSFSKIDATIAAPGNAPVTAVSEDANHMDLFVVGNDGHLYNNSWSQSTAWLGWSPIAGSRTFQTVPPSTAITAIAPQPGHVRAFGTANSGDSTWPNAPLTFWRDNGQWDQNGSWIPQNYDKANQPFIVGPIVPSPGDDGYHLFATDDSSAVVGAFAVAEASNPSGVVPHPGDGWMGWVPVVTGQELFGTNTLSSASVLYRDTGTRRWDVFLVGDDGKIWTNWRDNGTGNQWNTMWTPIAQGVVRPGSTITALSRYPNIIDLFVVGLDGGVYRNSRDDNVNNGAWNGWFRIGTSTDTIPQGSLVTAITKNPDHIDLFVVGNDGGIYTASWDADPNVFWPGQFAFVLPPIQPFPPATAPLDIPDHLSSDDLQKRRGQIKQAFNQVFANDQSGPPSNLTYLQEAYYFVPVYLAEQMQKQGQYTAALDWFRTVYDYGVPVAVRNIYFGFELETSLSTIAPRQADWLLDPLNPHLIAATRRYAYARYTILSIAQCLLDYADAQFTYDTAESDAHARTLYMTALALLDLAIFDQSTDPCERLTPVDDATWGGAVESMRRELTKIDRVSILATAVPEIRKALEGNAPWPKRLAAAQAVLSEAKRQVLPPPTLKELVANQTAYLVRLYSALLASPVLDTIFTGVTAAAGRAFDSALPEAVGPDAASAVAAAGRATALASTWAPAAAGAGTRSVALTAPSQATGGGGVGTAGMPLRPLPQGVMMVPSVSLSFCVPPNPLLDALRAHAKNDLYKLRNCMNIAGIHREVDPYSAPTDLTSWLPTIGAGGQISIPGVFAIPPTPYNYAFLIDRAGKLALTAATMEQAMLSAFEKYDAGLYEELQARQNLQVANQTVQLQSLTVKEATDGVALAQLQQQRAQTETNHFQQLLQSDVGDIEQGAINSMYAEAGLQIASSVASATAGVFSGIKLDAAGLASNAASQLASLASSFGTFASINQARANLEVQQSDWQYQAALGTADFNIAGQQIVNAQDQVAVANQQLNIAQLQATQKADVVNFLANKFTNADLYSWMSSVLLGVYSYFLRQATAVARTAENQMAFQRQETPPGFIKADYWQPPQTSSSTAPSNTQGLTGSARLLQDITQLDQYYLDTDKRKLQLTKTLSLAQLFPVELQRLRETGVMNFITSMRLFDQDFPGHYLRLIQKVSTSVIALIPPSQGIKATLSTTAATRVVIGPQVFQKIVVRRDPESVALTSPANATGVFTLDPQPNLLLPFQGLGVEAQWEFSMPKAANQFDYSTLADVLISIDYTAFDNPDYRVQVLRQLSDQTTAERPFSFRNDLADQWYDLHNPDQTATPMMVQFGVARTDFPPNIDDIRIQQVLLYFSRADGETFEIAVSALRFAEGASTSIVGGAAKTVGGVISTRRGNATSWMPMIGKTPFGNWQIVLPNTEVVRNWFANDTIDDILFDITYSARTPPFPQG